MSNSDISQYAPAVMQNKALLMLANEESNALYDIDPKQIPYLSYLIAINSQLPIPGTLLFIETQLSLSRSKDRKGRLEFAQAINKQPVIFPSQQPFTLPGAVMGQQENKPGLLSKLLSSKKKGDSNV